MRRIRQLLRTILLVFALILCALAAAVHSLIDLISRKKSNRKPTIQFMLSLVAKSIGLTINTEGANPKHCTLVVCNHVSWLDIPVLGGEKPVVFLSKSEVRKWPLIGYLAAAAGTVFVKRGSGQGDSIREQVREILESGVSVLVFPEGTTTDGRQVKAFNLRLIHAAQDAGLPILPVTIEYFTPHGERSTVAPFIGDDDFVSHVWRMAAEPAITVKLTFHPEVNPVGKDLEMFTEALRQKIEEPMVG